MAPHRRRRERVDWRCTSVCKEFEKINALPEQESYGDLVRVTVGDGAERRDFTVHRGLVCAASPYFNAAFNGYFKEAREGHVSLEADDPEVFQDFLDWLYTRQLPDLEDHGRLISLHLFAEERLVRALKIATVDGLVNGISQFWRIPKDAIGAVYKHTPPQSGLRKLMVDMVLLTHAGLDPDLQAIPEYRADYQATVVNMQWLPGQQTYVLTQREWRHINRCKFHEH